MPSRASAEERVDSGAGGDGRPAARRLPEPRRTRLELRFRLFGVPVRVGVLFWVASAALGVQHYADPETGTFGWFAFWMAAALVSVLVHEMGHVLVGRLFGMRGQVVLYGLGGLTLGVDDLARRWQRILVLLGGPLAGALVVAGVWGITFLPLPDLTDEARRMVGNGLVMLSLINCTWTLLNLLPLWPLDGGRVACEIGEGLFGPRGVTVALVLCLLTAGSLALMVAVMLALLLNTHFVPGRLDAWLPVAQRGGVWLLQFLLEALFCYLLWIRTFRALWPETKDGETDVPAGGS